MGFIAMSLQYEIQRAVVRLQCSGCGSEANATCNCGKPYVPAKVQAKERVEANPEKSNRAIAAELGIGEATVRRARAETTAPDDAVDERIGLDGKTRRMPVRDEPPPSEDEIKEGFLTVADFAMRISGFDLSCITPTPQMRRIVDQVIDAWTTAKETLNG
jgi:hypothetical protein